MPAGRRGGGSTSDRQPSYYSNVVSRATALRVTLGTVTASGVTLLPIDAFAAAQNTTTRTVRFYQLQRILQAPDRKGRIALYGPRHVMRMTTILVLVGLGLNLKAIRRFVERVDAGEINETAGCRTLARHIA